MYTDTKLSLPAETIYDIVTFIVAEYLDDLIFGPISLPRKLAEDTKDPMLSNTNPVHALLAASLQLRHRTLGVVSAALGIPIRKEGIWSLLKSKPWAKIRPVRAFCATPAEFNTPLPPMNNPAPERADMPDVLETGPIKFNQGFIVEMRSCIEDVLVLDELVREVGLIPGPSHPFVYVSQIVLHNWCTLLNFVLKSLLNESPAVAELKASAVRRSDTCGQRIRGNMGKAPDEFLERVTHSPRWSSADILAIIYKRARVAEACR